MMFLVSLVGGLAGPPTVYPNSRRGAGWASPSPAGRCPPLWQHQRSAARDVSRQRRGTKFGDRERDQKKTRSKRHASHRPPAHRPLFRRPPKLGPPPKRPRIRLFLFHSRLARPDQRLRRHLA